MREFEFTWDMPFDPAASIDGYSESYCVTRCLIDPFREVWGHHLYQASTLARDIPELYRPDVGMGLYTLEDKYLGIMVRINPDPTGQWNIRYRCQRRLTSTRSKLCIDTVTAGRPWVVISLNGVVMRGATTRGEALRNAFMRFDPPQPVHDPGAPPEGEDLDALLGLVSVAPPFDPYSRQGEGVEDLR